MATLTKRSYRPDDAAQVTDLINLNEKFAGGHPGFTVDDARAVFDAMIRDAESDTRLVFDDDDELVAFGLVPSPPPGGFRVDLYGGVHPEWRRQGLGREMLAWQLDRAAVLHRTEAPDVEWLAETSSVVGDDTPGRLFARFGFKPVRYFFEMVAPTAGAVPVPLPDGLRVTPYTPGTERAVYEAHMEAFEDHWGYQRREFEPWLTLALHADGFQPELSRIAYDGDEIAGYALSYNDAAPDRVYLGQVGTRRPWRRRGLASALLSEVLKAAAAAGRDYASLGVDADSPTGAVGVYERAGFEVEYRAIAYRIVLP